MNTSQINSSWADIVNEYGSSMLNPVTSMMMYVDSEIVIRKVLMNNL